VKQKQWSREAERMIQEQLVTRHIRGERLLQAFREVPRHLFVPQSMQDMAYADGPLPIGQRQTISQPYIVALMTQLLELTGEERVLEVGTGSGYQAAILAKLARKVFSVERIPELAERAAQVLMDLELSNVEVVVCDGSMGLPAHAPYDAIIVTAAAPRVPEPLKDQLAPGGRLVLPVGGRDGQMLERWRQTPKRFERENIAPVAFVPLVGDHGWEEGEQPTRWWT